MSSSGKTYEKCILCDLQWMIMHSYIHTYNILSNRALWPQHHYLAICGRKSDTRINFIPLSAIDLFFSVQKYTCVFLSLLKKRKSQDYIQGRDEFLFLVFVTWSLFQHRSSLKYLWLLLSFHFSGSPPEKYIVIN